SVANHLDFSMSSDGDPLKRNIEGNAHDKRRRETYRGGVNCLDRATCVARSGLQSLRIRRTTR
ncbi:MAG: hypothetical protein N2C14_23410, partial [Planctomycetales bacterium]